MCLFVSKRAGTRKQSGAQTSSVFQNPSFIGPRVLECPSSEHCRVTLAKETAETALESTMQAWGFVVFILATVMISTADAKIYERCELAMKLQKAGLNGYRGYGIGDCEIPLIQVLIHTPS